MYADMTKCVHFLIRKEISDWKNAYRGEEPQAFNGNVDATITFSRRCK